MVGMLEKDKLLMIQLTTSPVIMRVIGDRGELNSGNDSLACQIQAEVLDTQSFERYS